MKQLEIGDFKRISKAAAKKLYDNGGTVYVCPINMDPTNPYWSMAAEINKQDLEGLDFNKMINQYTYYNCINNQTGLYPAFYVEVNND